MGLKGRLKRVERHLKVDGTRIELQDGSTVTVTWQDSVDKLASNWRRLVAAYKGAPVPPPHPVAVALLKARCLPPGWEEAAEYQRRIELQIEWMQQREEAGEGSSAHHRKDRS